MRRPEPFRAPLGVRSGSGAVFLVGFMGAGKTCVGRALGQQLNWTFEDLDDRIERREGRTVTDIFRDSGEAEFRRAEHHALRSVLEEVNGEAGRIIALGGGAFVQDGNALLLKESRLPTVFLYAPVEELWRRCSKQTSETGPRRPLQQSREQFAQLYEKRRKFYESASFTVQTEGRTVDEVAAEIARKLALRKIEIRIEQGEVE